MSAILSARGLRVVYGDRHVLRDVDLDLSPGEVLGVLGPSGAGKSTLFGALTGDGVVASGVVRASAWATCRSRRACCGTCRSRTTS
jgi:ABC-type multidrug transport system ATPase subunit